MIDRRQFREALERALAFHNLPAPARDGERETFVMEGVARPGTRLVSDRIGTDKLWREWRQWIADYQRGADVNRLRAWCVKNSFDDRGQVTIDFNEFQRPFSFDENGRPQTTLFATGLQGTLALAGAELIAPDAPFGIMKCGREECANLIVKVLVRHREYGPPTLYCRLPDGTSHRPTASERGAKYRDPKTKHRKKK